VGAFEQFIADRRRASDKKPLRSKTVRSYRQSYAVFRPALSRAKYEEGLVEEFRTIIDARLGAGKVDRSGMNVYIRGFNSFLSWCRTFGFLKHDLKIKELTVDKRRAFPTLGVDDIRNWQKFAPVRLSQLSIANREQHVLDYSEAVAFGAALNPVEFDLKTF
jgi:hypothetical protein